MRVTQSQIYGRLAVDLQRALRATTEAQRQVATGRKFEQVSGEPLAGVDVLQAQAGMRAIAQYRRNLGQVRTRLDTTEAAVNQLMEILDNARSIAIQQGTATASTATRAASVNDLVSMMEQAASLGNMKIGSEYVFAGNQSTTPAFTFDGTTITYNGDTANRQSEISEGYLIQSSTNGDELLMSSGIAQALSDLRTALAADDAPGIAAADTALSAAFGNLQSTLGGIGARQRAMDDVTVSLTALDVLLETRESDAWNIDIEEATVGLAESQQALQSALLAASKVLDLNLTNYLR